MTIKQLEEIKPLDFAVMILEERLDKLYKRDTPLAKKLQESIDAVQFAKEYMGEA